MNDPKSNQPEHDDVTRLSPTVVIPTAPSPELARDLTEAYVASKVPKVVGNFAGRGFTFVVPQKGKRTLGGPDRLKKEDLFYSVVPGIEIETEFATLRADPRGVLMTLVDETPHTVTVFSDAPPRTYAAGESFRLEENSRLRLGPIADAVLTQQRDARDDRFDLELAVRYLGEVSCEISRSSMQSVLNALGDNGTQPRSPSPKAAGRTALSQQARCDGHVGRAQFRRPPPFRRRRLRRGFARRDRRRADRFRTRRCLGMDSERRVGGDRGLREPRHARRYPRGDSCGVRDAVPGTGRGD